MSDDNFTKAMSAVGEIRTITEAVTGISQKFQSSGAFQIEGKQLQNIVVLIQDELSNIKVAVAGLKFEHEIDKLKALGEAFDASIGLDEEI